MRTPWVIRQIIAIMIVIGIAVGALHYLKNTKPQAEKKTETKTGPLVEVIRAELSTVAMNVTGYGTVRAKTNLRLTVQIPGEIVYAAPFLREGKFINKGDLLLRIDPRNYQFAVESLESQIRQAETELDRLDQEEKNAKEELGLMEEEVSLAKRELDRYDKLLESESDSIAARDKAELQWVSRRARAIQIKNQINLIPVRREGVKAQLAQLNSKLNEAKLNLERTEIKAPFDGRVAERMVEEGQFVNVGAAMARIYDTAVVEIPVRIPMEDLQWISFDALLDSEIDEAPPYADVCLSIGNRDFYWEGIVARLEPEIDQATRTVGLIIEVSNPWAKENGDSAPPLVPGTFVKVKIKGRDFENIAVLPRGAVADGNVVYLDSDARLEIRSVSVMRAGHGLSYIDEGIDAGELVIVSPLNAPVEGMLVRHVAPEDKTPTAVAEEGSAKKDGAS